LAWSNPYLYIGLPQEQMAIFALYYACKIFKDIAHASYNIEKSAIFKGCLGWSQ
jgi:hypothetical protein